jgi:hypothetical protein
LLENCFFYIWRMYEFLHSQGHKQTHAPQQTTRMWVWVLSDRGGPGHTPMYVRFGPKATVGNPNTIRRFVPGTDLSRP